MNDELENTEYCDMNHSGQEHEWTWVRTMGDPQNPREKIVYCKYCNLEKTHD